MKKESAKTRSVSDGQRSNVQSMIIRDLLNVTWRMTVPTVLGIGVGLGIDKVLGTHPALFLIGAVVGFFVGIYMAILVLRRSIEGKA